MMTCLLNRQSIFRDSLEICTFAHKLSHSHASSFQIK